MLVVHTLAMMLSANKRRIGTAVRSRVDDRCSVRANENRSMQHATCERNRLGRELASGVHTLLMKLIIPQAIRRRPASAVRSRLVVAAVPKQKLRSMQHATCQNKRFLQWHYTNQQ